MERGRERKGEGEGGRWRGRIGRIVPVKFGEIPHCCVQKVDRDTWGWTREEE